MANIANTVFELNVISEGETEIVVPDTGAYTNLANDSNGANGAYDVVGTVLMILAIVMATLSVAVHIICKKVAKKSKKFALSNKKLNLVRLSSVIVFLMSLGLFGKIVIADQYFTYAANKNVDVELSSVPAVTINKNKNDIETSCSGAKVTLIRPQQSGYNFNDYILYMSATELKDEAGNVIGRIVEDSAALEGNTWGYKMNENDTSYHQIPSAKKAINANVWNGDNEELTISFCVKLSPEIEDGTYVSMISFSAMSEGEEIAQPVERYTVTTGSNGHGTVLPGSITDIPKDTAVSISSSSPSFILNGVTVTAHPDNGYEFASWVNGCGMKVTENCTITANFREVVEPVTNYTVTINSGGNGSVSPDSVTVPENTSVSVGSAASFSLNGVTIVAIPSNGYEFDTWTNGCGSKVTGNCTITANFKARMLTVNITTDPIGTVNMSSMTVPYGTMISAQQLSSSSFSIGGNTIISTPNSGYTFYGWENGCGNMVTENNCTIKAKINITVKVISNPRLGGHVVEDLSDIPTPTDPSMIETSNMHTMTGPMYGLAVSFGTKESYNSVSIERTINGTIMAVPLNGYTFSGWNNGCGNTVTQNCSIYANFTSL